MQTIIDGDVVAYRAAFIGANNGMDLDEVLRLVFSGTHKEIIGNDRGDLVVTAAN